MIISISLVYRRIVDFVNQNHRKMAVSSHRQQRIKKITPGLESFGSRATHGPTGSVFGRNLCDYGQKHPDPPDFSQKIGRNRRARRYQLVEKNPASAMRKRFFDSLNGGVFTPPDLQILRRTALPAFRRSVPPVRRSCLPTPRWCPTARRFPRKRWDRPSSCPAANSRPAHSR